jgi:hypothetical protein
MLHGNQIAPEKGTGAMVDPMQFDLERAYPVYRRQAARQRRRVDEADPIAPVGLVNRSDYDCDCD